MGRKLGSWNPCNKRHFHTFPLGKNPKHRCLFAYFVLKVSGHSEKLYWMLSIKALPPPKASISFCIFSTLPSLRFTFSFKAFKRASVSAYIWANSELSRMDTANLAVSTSLSARKRKASKGDNSDFFAQASNYIPSSTHAKRILGRRDYNHL